MRRVFAAGLFLLAIGAVAYFAQSSDPFTMHVSFDGSEVRFQPDQGPVWNASYTLSPEHPGPVYVTDTAVGPEPELLESVEYCFSVELVEGDLVMRSLRGASWRELSYGCGGSGSCEFVVSESGVRGVAG